MSCAFLEETLGDAEVSGRWRLLLPVGPGSPRPRLVAFQQVGMGCGARGVARGSVFTFVEFRAQEAGFACPRHGDHVLSHSLASDCY